MTTGSAMLYSCNLPLIMPERGGCSISHNWNETEVQIQALTLINYSKGEADTSPHHATYVYNNPRQGPSLESDFWFC